MRSLHRWSAAAIAAVAPLATAGPINVTPADDINASGASPVALERDAGGATATLAGLSVSAIDGDPSNLVFQISLGQSERVVALDWELHATAENPAMLSDLRVAIYTRDVTGTPLEGLLIEPAQGLWFDGSFTLTDERLGGITHTNDAIDLLAEGLEIGPGDDGLVFVEFFTVFGGPEISFGDDSRMRFLVVPSPAGAVLLGAGMLACARRRR